jgi:esterase/lipase
VRKNSFILIPSFSTNSLILKGLISRLSDYFKVYPLDYSGYRSNTPPLNDYSIQNVVEKLEKDIENLNLNSYVIGGVSMGYLFTNKIKANKKCNGIVAMFPLVSDKTINIKPIKKSAFQIGLNVVRLSKIYDLIWRSKHFKKIFINKYFPKDISKIMSDEINPRSFFEITNLILNKKYEIQINTTPHVIIINDYDYAIKSSITMSILESKIPNKMIIKSDMPHNPNSLDKKVFDKYLDDTKMKNIVKYFDNYI